MLRLRGKTSTDKPQIQGLPILGVMDLGAPALASTTAVHAAITRPATGTTVVTTTITNPDVPRVATATGNASGITGNVVLVGTDYFGNAATDTIALSGSSTVAGVVAFKTITKITVPAKTNSSGDTAAIGTGTAIGMYKCLGAATQVVLGLLDRAVVAPTITVSATAISGNTIDISSGTYNGTKHAVVLWYP